MSKQSLKKMEKLIKKMEKINEQIKRDPYCFYGPVGKEYILLMQELYHIGTSLLATGIKFPIREIPLENQKIKIS